MEDLWHEFHECSCNTCQAEERRELKRENDIGNAGEKAEAMGTETKSKMNPRLRMPNIKDHSPIHNDRTPATIPGGILTGNPAMTWVTKITEVVVGATDTSVVI